mgnify:FL=1
MTTIQLHHLSRRHPMKKIVVAALTLVGLTVIVKLVADKIND